MIATGANRSETFNERLRRMIALHFDPESGSPYWLELAGRLGFDPREDIRSAEDLARLGPMDQQALAGRPVEDFIPRSLLCRRREFIFAETGGTLGDPKFAVHRDDEFAAAFVEPFVVAAGRAGFPRGANWLFVGPTGPHIIGRAAVACATELDSPAPFNVDFDPRWAKKLPEGSFARGRYIEHIRQQALRVLNTQHVGVIFSTPPVLEGLGERLAQDKRLAVRGIHFGGMAVTAQLREKLGGMFPNAVMLSGYGNTLLGMSPELSFAAAEGISYYPHGERLMLMVVPVDGDDAERIAGIVAYGECGQVMAHRLDETQLIVNLLERDSAVRVAPPEDAKADGFIHDGIRDPQPIVSETFKPALGLY